MKSNDLAGRTVRYISALTVFSDSEIRALSSNISSQALRLHRIHFFFYLTSLHDK